MACVLMKIKRKSVFSWGGGTRQAEIQETDIFMYILLSDQIYVSHDVFLILTSLFVMCKTATQQQV